MVQDAHHNHAYAVSERHAYVTQAGEIIVGEEHEAQQNPFTQTST
jgi:hypothetical protein